MKIAVTSQGKDLEAGMDPRFGRAQSFIVYDLDTDEFEVVDNEQNFQAAQGAGIQAAKTVSDLGVGAVVTGNCGPKAYRALNAAGITVALCNGGTVKEAVAKYKAGDLEISGRANVEGHWS